MKNGNKFLALALALSFIVGSTSMVFAWDNDRGGPHHGRHMSGGHNGAYGPGGYDKDFTAEQRQELDKLFEEHGKKVEPLFKEMDRKNFDLNDEMNNEKPDESKITNLYKEIGELKGKIYSERGKFRGELNKKGLAPKGGNYRGHSGGSYGGGQGPCWR